MNCPDLPRAGGSQAARQESVWCEPPTLEDHSHHPQLEELPPPCTAADAALHRLTQEPLTDPEFHVPPIITSTSVDLTTTRDQDTQTRPARQRASSTSLTWRTALALETVSREKLDVRPPKSIPLLTQYHVSEVLAKAHRARLEEEERFKIKLTQRRKRSIHTTTEDDDLRQDEYWNSMEGRHVAMR